MTSRLTERTRRRTFCSGSTAARCRPRRRRWNGAEALPDDGIDLRAHLFAIEHRLIREALQRSGGTVAQAARLLGLRRTTLVEKLRKFGIAGGDSLSEV